jgi:hypothetical protein
VFCIFEVKMTDKKYTEKQTAFLEALMGEGRGNIRKAMDIAGYSKGTNQGEVTGPLREEIIERASMMLAMNAPKAAHGLVDVLNDPTALGARNAINAAREVLDRTGLVKREKIEVTNNGGGMFILPPKADDLEKQN